MAFEFRPHPARGQWTVVDCHVHALPAQVMAAFRSWVAESGTRDEGPPHLWMSPAFETPELQVAALNRAGIQAAVLTFSSHAPTALHAAALTSNRRGPEMIRVVNDELAAWAAASEKQLIATAWVDPQLGEAALVEMERVVKELHVPALSVLSAYGRRGQGLRFLDHPDFWPVLQLAAELRVPIFVHASGRFRLADVGEPPLPDLVATYLQGGLSMLLENTLCLIRLALNGVFDRLPELRVVVGQLGGLFPFTLGRFDLIYDLVIAAAQTATGVEPPSPIRANEVLRRLRDYAGHVYVDTHSMDQAAILCALEVLGHNHVLYGSDFPVTPEALGRQAGLEAILSLPVSAAVQAAILGGSVADLLRL